MIYSHFNIHTRFDQYTSDLLQDITRTVHIDKALMNSHLKKKNYLLKENKLK